MPRSKFYQSDFIQKEVVPKIRRKQLAYRTEQTYVDWIGQFNLYHRFRNRDGLLTGIERKVETFLAHLAAERKLSASTQNVAFSALLFLYRQVLRVGLREARALRAKEGRRLPVIVDRQTAIRVIESLPDETHRLMAGLLYGSGLRLMECVRLRVKDVDTVRLQVTVRDGKGRKDRVTIMPRRLVEPLRRQVEYVRQLHKADLARGLGEVYLPAALARKYRQAARETGWQHLFPAASISGDPRAPGSRRRHHLSESGLQKAVKAAVTRLQVDKRISCRTFRHSFATHMLEDLTARGENLMAALEQVKEYLGHAYIKTTMIYVQLMKKTKARSPLDQ